MNLSRFFFLIMYFVFFLAISTVHGQTKSDSLAPYYRSMAFTHQSLLENLSLSESIPQALSFSFKKGLSQSCLPSLAPTAIFCVLESHLESSSKIPIRMRLGSLDFTNSVEGKNPFNVQQVNTSLISQ